MKSKLTFISVLILAAAVARAGIYSDAIGGTGIDQGIAGFVDGQVNPIFAGWATTVVNYTTSPQFVAPPFKVSGKALDSVAGNSGDIVSLGDMTAADLAAWRNGTGGGPGSITLGFATAITNGAGADFAAFENTNIPDASGKVSADLGYVEVSTNGSDFVRFPSIYTASATAIPNMGTLDPTGVYNLVGKHTNGYSGQSYGTPFDLSDLENDSLVLSGLVDLDEINFVRIVDIPGDGSFKDSLGNSIYDQYLSMMSGGVDLEAIGVINQVPEPATITILALGGLALRRRK
jgi:hypothetical protein